MNARRLLPGFAIALMLVWVVAAVSAEPGGTPIIDGDIGEDWEIADLVVDDAVGESPWGPNDLDNLYVTFDDTNLYLGVEYLVDNNGMIIYIDSGRPGGETDFNSANGYTGGWQRNLQFPAANDIDLILPRWNDGEGQAWIITDNTGTMTDTVTSAGTYSGTMAAIEYAVPWSVLNRVGDICIVATIVGGDDWNGPDAMPDNAAMDGSGNPTLIDNFYCIPEISTAVTMNNAGTSGSDYGAMLALVSSLLIGFTAISIRRKTG